MKNLIAWRFLAAMFLAMGLVAAPALADVAEMAPESSELLIRVPALESIFNIFSITENSVLGQPIEDVEDIQEELRFNPLKLSEWKARGVDVTKSFGLIIDSLEISAENKKFSFNGAVFLPVTDANRAMDALKTIISKETPEIEWSTDGPFTMLKSPDGDDKSYFFEKAGYLFIGGAPDKDPRPFMERIAKAGKGLAENDDYKKATDRLSDKQEIFAYIDAARMMGKNIEAVKKLARESAEKKSGFDLAKNIDYLKDWKSAGLGIDFDTKDFIIDSVVNMEPGTKTLALVKDVHQDKGIVMGIKDAPALLISFGVKAREYYDMIMESMSEENRLRFQNKLEGIKADFGVDLASDVIDNLAGSLNLGLYDGVSINMMNYNALLTLNLKDGAKMTRVIETIIDRMPPEQKNIIQKITVETQESYMISFMGMVQLFMGVKDNNLIVALGKNMYDKALAADVNTGFLTNIKDPDLVSALKSDATSIFYLNAQETFKAVRNFAPMLQHLSGDPGKPLIDETLINAVNQFNYLMSSSKVKDNDIISSLIIKTNFMDSFFQGVTNIADSFKEKAEVGDEQKGSDPIDDKGGS